jgi:hypothetical protein
MKIAGAIFGFIILAVVFVVWIRAYKKIKDEDGASLAGGKRKSGGQQNSLEDFIAAYKRGEVTVGAGQSAAPAQIARPAPVATPAAAPPVTAAVRRESFISGPTKLAYLTCKTGLRDHHVFAQVQLAALSSGGPINPALERSAVDLLICNAALAAVAAIDLIEAGSNATHAAKSEHLKALGIRYLRLSAKSLPRPDELHALLYKM